MYGSTYGNILKVTTFGESHGKGLGVVIDGCPAGLPLSEEDIQPFLNRRKPGQSKYTTARQEKDLVEILSGIFEGRTTGTPISMLVRNQDQKSKDYAEIKSCFRPGHADYTYDQKYGFRDYRGGGRSSGRETIARVAAGAVAVKILKQMGISFYTYTASIGPISISPEHFDFNAVYQNPLYMPDSAAAKQAETYLEECMKNKDSSGGTIECRIHGVPAGIGEPVFDKLDACLSKGIFSIGAVKAVEIGDGISASTAKGSEYNDCYSSQAAGITKLTNHSGGILGGISDGGEIRIRAFIKPTPSIASPQKTINQSGENIEIEIKGRHDPVIVPRAVVVVESMAALTLLDAMLGGMTSRMEHIIRFFNDLS